MANKTMNTRIQLKCDTEANWSKASNFTPQKGEAIIYSADSTHPFSRLKVGDGSTNINSLPFIDASTVEGKTIKINTTAYWNSLLDFIPNKGDLIFYSDKVNGIVDIPGLKIGDGLAYCVDLPFVGDDILNALNAHTSNITIHITATERANWNNKITCDDSVTNEILVLRRS